MTAKSSSRELSGHGTNDAPAGDRDRAWRVGHREYPNVVVFRTVNNQKMAAMFDLKAIRAGESLIRKFTETTSSWSARAPSRNSSTAPHWPFRSSAASFRLFKGAIVTQLPATRPASPFPMPIGPDEGLIYPDGAWPESKRVGDPQILADFV